MSKGKRIGNTRKSEQRGNSNSKTNGAMKDCGYAKYHAKT